MKKFRLLLCVALLSFAMPKTLLAWNDGDQFTIKGITYMVLSAEDKTVTAASCTASGTVTIPSTVRSIDEDFKVTAVGDNQPINSHWTNVTGVTFATPCNVTAFFSHAFYDSKITSLTIPQTVTEIPSSWNECITSTLKTITVASENPRYQSQNGVLYTKNLKSLLFCPKSTTQLSASNTTFSIPNGVDSIMANAFNKVANLVTLSIPASVKYVSEDSYSIAPTTTLSTINVNAANENYCSVSGVLFTKDMRKLVLFPMNKNANGSYTVPNGVKELASYAFYRNNLTSLNFNQVEVIKNRCFYTSQRLANINIPASTRIIAPGAFSSMYNVTSISVNANNPNFTIINNALYDISGDTLKFYPTGRTATSYGIAANTVVIQYRAFETSENLVSVTIPQSVTTIEDLGFYSSFKLKTVTFLATSQVKTMGNGCFYSCRAMEGITIPASVQTIGSAAFGDCWSLKNVTIAENSQLKSIGAECFRRANQTSILESFTFSDSCQLDSIGYRAFADTKLKSFEFPAKTRYIGESAFNGCTQLSSVTFPAEGSNLRLDTICGGAFANTAFTLKDGDIPSSVRCIGREAFWNVKTSPSLAISSRTDSISPEAFKGCYTLKALNVDKANQKYSSLGGMLLTKDKETLVLFPPGKAGEKFNLLAPSLRRIGDYAFYENQLLTSVIIPNRVTSLGKRAFGLCPNLNTVTLLCENYLDPANIAQLLNEATFDDGVTTTTDYRKNIALHVRKHLLSQYENEPYYDLYFKSIAPSFNPMKNPANAAEGLNANEEYIAVSQNEASLIAASSPDETYVVPKTVNRNRLDQYTVAMVGDYAFHGCSPGTSEVVVPGEVSYVGAKSFLSDTASVAASTIKSIFLLAGPQDERTFSTTRFELDDTGNDYSEFANNTKVYVRKSTYNSADFQNAVTRYTVGNSVHPRTRNMFSYQIPGISITKSYGTFAREFDVDLSEYARELEEQYGPDAGGRVFAFAAPVDRPGSYFKPGGGDNPEAKGTYYVRFTSLEHTRADGTIADGTYIPANTGVLLKSWDGLTQTDDDFFYCIGEDGDGMAETPAQSFLVGVTRNKAEVKDTGRNIFVMSGGLFKPLNGQTVASFPLHKAYLKLDGFPGATTGAKVMLVFDDDTVPTTIGSPGADEGMEGTGDIHDLQGRRVAAPRKGIYVKNGKKIVIK